MRDAIDRYKDASDKNLIKVAAGTEGYPPDLDTLVKGVKLTSAQDKDKQVRFLREIPVDPMTGTKDWGLRSVQDDADSNSWGGQDVFDVYSKSTGHGAGWHEVFGLVAHCRSARFRESWRTL